METLQTTWKIYHALLLCPTVRCHKIILNPTKASLLALLPQEILASIDTWTAYLKCFSKASIVLSIVRWIMVLGARRGYDRKLLHERMLSMYKKSWWQCISLNFIIYVTKWIGHDCHPAMMSVVAYLSNTGSEALMLQENSLSDLHHPMCGLVINMSVGGAVGVKGYDGVQPKISPTISFYCMYWKPFIYCWNRTNFQ